MDAIAGLLFLFTLFALYMLPGMVASARHHANVNAIVALNLFLGWTFIGWVVALVWALTAQGPRALPQLKVLFRVDSDHTAG